VFYCISLYRGQYNQMRSKYTMTQAGGSLETPCLYARLGLVVGFLPKAGTLEQLVEELALEAGDPGGLGGGAVGAMDQIAQVLALEARDELVFGLVKRAIGLEHEVGVGRGERRAEHERQRLEVVVGPGERDRTRDHVAQLAHVARPVIALEPIERG